MKVKTSKLIGPALDWAVATAAKDIDFHLYWRFYTDGQPTKPHWGESGSSEQFRPSTRWDHAGPILTAARISRTIDHSGLWIAFHGFNYDDAKEHMQCDASELVAGLRCFVARELGDEVDVPEELL